MYVKTCERGLNNGRVYITRSVIMRFFPVDPDDRVIMELQCTRSKTGQILESIFSEKV